MHPTTRKHLASLLWPRFSHTVEQFNYNASFWDWVGTHADNVAVFANRVALYEEVQARCGSAPISYLEFGVWKGESLNRWTDINRDPESRFYGFDSFEGLPEPWTHSFGQTTGAGSFGVDGQIPEFDDDRVVLIKGWFQETLRRFLSTTELRHPIVVNNDSDLYSSTMYTLATLDPVLKSGDVIIFDEFSSPAHEFKAWMEYQQAFMRDAECIAMSDRWNQAAFRIV